MDVFDELTRGSIGAAFIQGPRQLGYLKVQVDGQYVEVEPFDDPDEAPERLAFVARHQAPCWDFTPTRAGPLGRQFAWSASTRQVHS